jgi:hypothetical protein
MDPVWLPSRFGLVSASLALVFFFAAVFFAKRERRNQPDSGFGTTLYDFFEVGTEVTLEDITRWQLYAPSLKEVIVLCDRIEAPVSYLQEAVIANFQTCVKHKFFVSPHDYENYYENNIKYFRRLYDFALELRPVTAKTHKIITPSVSFEDLFQIYELRDPWNNSPYIFYRSSTPDGMATRALRGNTGKTGLSYRYQVVEPKDAHAIVTTILNSEAVPRISVTLDELQKQDSTILPFRTKGQTS